jgi:phosphopantetheine--protein transferase-like protein
MHIYNREHFEVEERKSLLLDNLSKYLKKDACEIQIKNNENGKPTTEGIYFSVSHSHNYLVQAFSDHSEIGVDIEKMNSKRNYLGLSNRYFNPHESDYLNQLSSKESQILFYQLWSAKEAVCKAEGGRLWFYLNYNFLDSNGQFKSEVNNHSIFQFDQIQNFSMCLASNSPFQTVELIYE